jgi:hypothetical protein
MLDFRQAAMVTQYNKNLFDGTDEKDTEAGSAQQSSSVKPADGGRSVDGSPFSYIKSGQLSTLG